jgi:hypothetical protein
VDPLYGYKATVGYQGAPTAYAAPAYSPPPVQPAPPPAYYTPAEYAVPRAEPAPPPAYQPRYDPPAYRPAYSDYSAAYAYGPRAHPVYAVSAPSEYAYAAAPAAIAVSAPSDYNSIYHAPPRSYLPYSGPDSAARALSAATATVAPPTNAVTALATLVTSTPAPEVTTPANLEEVVIKEGNRT